jgi:hypothetical protein
MPTQAYRDQLLQLEKELKYQSVELRVSSETGTVTLFAPTTVATATYRIISVYDQLCQEFSRRPVEVVAEKMQAQLQAAIEASPTMKVVELRRIRSGSRADQGIVRFRLTFEPGPEHGTWVLEIPPVTSGSLILESEYAARRRAAAGESPQSEGSLVGFRRR